MMRPARGPITDKTACRLRAGQVLALAIGGSEFIPHRGPAPSPGYRG